MATHSWWPTTHAPRYAHSCGHCAPASTCGEEEGKREGKREEQGGGLGGDSSSFLIEPRSATLACAFEWSAERLRPNVI